MQTLPSKFPLPMPSIQAVDDDQWILKEKYELEFTVKNKRYKLVSMPGATFDGLSKPYFLQAVPIMGFWLGGKLTPRELPGGFDHDQLYQGEFLPRQECDEAFLWLEWKNEVGFFHRRVYYRGVRVVGSHVWNEHTNESIHYAREHNKLYTLKLGHWSLIYPPARNINN